MFKQIKEAFTTLLSLVQQDSSYTVMLVPNDGSAMKEKTVGTEHFKKATYALALAAALFVGSIGTLYYVLAQSNAEAAELAEFRRTKIAQEQKLQELSVMSEKVQQDMAALSKIEEQVREQMKQSGMEVPAPSMAQKAVEQK